MTTRQSTLSTAHRPSTVPRPNNVLGALDVSVQTVNGYPTPISPPDSRACSIARHTGGVTSSPTTCSRLSRRASSVHKLDLEAALETERFGLGNVTVTTSPSEDGLPAEGDSSSRSQARTPSASPTENTDCDRGGEYLTAMSKPEQSRSIHRTATSPPSSGGRTPIAPVGIPSSSRHRQPVPPSPLSRIEATPSNGSSDSSSATRTPSLSPPPSYVVPETSPCFIHSLLDQHGSLQDRLKQKNNPPTSPRQATSSPRHHNHHHHHGNASSPVRTHHYHHQSKPESQSRAHFSIKSATTSPDISRVTSPTDASAKESKEFREQAQQSGYESDRSSAPGGSAILDGDLMDDDEEAASLTRKLAETAQGVREMSKELGRTRVRSKIQHILIVTKARDNRLIKLTRELALYLMLKKPTNAAETPSRPASSQRGMVVYVDAQLRNSKRFDAAGIQRDYPALFQPISRRRSNSSVSVNNLSAYPSTVSMSDPGKRRDEGQLRYWTGEMCSNAPQLFDFVVTLGGDGTVLFTSWLFQRIVPPVLPFALGSLGFLTNFDFANYKSTMDKAIDDGIRVNLRMRFTCTVYRAIAPEEAEYASANGRGRKAIKKPDGEILMSAVDRSGWEALEGSGVARDDGQPVVGGKDKEIMCFSTRPVEQFEVLNDLVVDRGPSPYVSLLEVFGDEHHLTTVQADGLTVSTPTGSTAYSLSAGGSLVHPQIPALLLTPICPHTLSFRPMLLPDGMELRICVPYNSRSTAWASFDGRGRVELKQGDHIKVTASKYPFPTVCANQASTDWFNSISRTLRWNEREKQKSFVVVEEDNEPPSQNRRRDSDAARKRAEATHKEINEEDEDEEEGEFDIDDKSGGEMTGPSSPTGRPVNRRLKSFNSDDTAHTNGVNTPDRFVTPYGAPPPLSQRHLVEALTAAELQSKEGEVGQRDEIRSGPEQLRVGGGHGHHTHMIPPGRSQLTSPVDDDKSKHHPEVNPDHAPNSATAEKTPRAHNHRTEASGSESRSMEQRRPQRKMGAKVRREEGKAKAFAFFGQDDSASDISDAAPEFE